ncbi:hypothetical protein G6F40_016563 [Rhizopus arrhizus]|nr:hypothetical protein G6F40_016563 [Rhizopus arrhizus]
MLEGEVARPQRQGADDLGVRLERHVQHPVELSCIATLLVDAARGARALHPVVEDEAQQQDDQEVDDRKRRGRAQVELAHGLLREVLRQERGGVARPAARQHEGLGIDHEAVHEAQQHRDHQHAAHLGQLD